MHVADLMRSDVVTCRTDETLADAARRMWECDVGALPVLAGDGRVVGMLTDRDVAMAALLRGLPLGAMGVGETARRTPVGCAREASLDEAEALMADHQVRRLLVLDAEGRLLGLITLSDLAGAASDFAGDTGLTSIHLARTLRAVCSPRPPS